VFGGDLTDSYHVASEQVKERMIACFHDHLADGHPFFYTYGQHDLRGRDYDRRGETTVGFIMRLVERLGKNTHEIPVGTDILVDLADKKTKIVLTACPSGVDPVTWFKEAAGRRLMTELSDVRIAVMHHLVSDAGSPWLVDPRLLDARIGPNLFGFDVVLCGDLHDGYGPQVDQNGVLFVNPGSIARTKKTKNDLARTIMGADVIIEKHEDSIEIRAETWQVECAKPASEVFRQDAPLVNDEITLDQPVTDDSADRNFDNVVKRLSSVVVKKTDVWSLLERCAAEVHLDPSVLSYVMSKRPTA
jgi:predicted phosphodiesterase